MSFAQLTYRESLRDIKARLRSMSCEVYRMDFPGEWMRSNLADANESRDLRIYTDVAQFCGESILKSALLTELGDEGTLSGIFENPGSAVVPASLYLEQLRERLGPKALRNIGYGESE